ncbi:deoxynucleoside kinase [Niveibacterium umoris]|uniref:Deoxyadenosine/deoxycytidine kinase n=1 Tax=Niveibacterium umoris TaxID=1193620 RepID=A0A840BHU5_9RHOO|nr:deoxynucleoside kinase [Niveibacterium umoris]MBB4011864.1 deoxyadenosine/deoxycytidine kinase [Niveibacterium umoris]
MLDKARHIVVEGPIGAGKTSFAQRLAQRLDADLMLEQPELNPFLERFYDNMDRWALATQVAFLYQRHDLLTRFSSHPLERRVVSDFLIEKDPLFAGLTLGPDEERLYQRLYSTLQPQIPRPDLVIYLQAQPEILMDRVRKRGVGAERNITESYLASVSERYASFFHQYDAAPLFIVNAEVLNPIDHDDDFELLVDRLTAMRSYREFFGYAQ